MAGLTDKSLASTYKGLLKTKGDNVAVPTGATAIQIVDGEENVTPLYLTDGEAPAPEECPKNTLWVLSAQSEMTDHLPGQIIQLNTH